MWIKVLEIIILSLYITFNFMTANILTARQMRKEFIDGQCMVGRIFSNVFYAPAWFLKGLKIVINEFIV